MVLKIEALEFCSSTLSQSQQIHLEDAFKAVVANTVKVYGEALANQAILMLSCNWEGYYEFCNFYIT